MNTLKFFSRYFYYLLLLSMLHSSLTANNSFEKVQKRLDILGLENSEGAFYPQPEQDKVWNLNNLGPVGIGIDISPPQFSMIISNVENGSPADKSGKFKKGMTINSINGINLISKKMDPRIMLGNIITEAEATDGKIILELIDGEKVIINIPILGRYSKTWPLDCKKSDKIVRGLANLLSKHEKAGWGSVLFLLSTGEENDLEVVKKWMKKLVKKHHMPYNWHKGYRGPGLCEYYLRTGDKTILPLIRKCVGELKNYEYIGGWAGRSRGNFRYGQMNAAGVHCLTFLLLAKMCGVEVDNDMLQRCLIRFYRYAGHASVPYGNGLPEGGYRENGKTGALAVAMSAAVRLSPEGENSIYAKVRDLTAMKSFYASNWFHAAHTGGGIGEIWNHASISLMHEKRPLQYRSYLDTRRWVMDLSRRYNGGIGIAGVTDGYDKAAAETTGGYIWGNFFALTYTIPRKNLQLYGAPKTKWCKSFKLPKRPWGNEMDDAFISSQPVAVQGGITVGELLNEVIQHDSSVPIHSRLAKGDAKVYDKYLSHPEFVIRSATMRAMTNNNDASKKVISLLKSKDPRSRYNGILAINGMFKGSALPKESLTSEMFDLIGSMIENKNESWWVLQGAAKAIRRGGVTHVAKHKKRLLELLQYDEWWVKMSAHESLSSLGFHEDYYKEILPQLINSYVTYNTGVLQHTCMLAMRNDMKNSSGEIKDYALNLLQDSYSKMPQEITYSNGYTIQSGGVSTRRRYSMIVATHPKGRTVIMKEPRITTSYVKSGDINDLYRYNKKDSLDWNYVGVWHEHFYKSEKPPRSLFELKRYATTLPKSKKGRFLNVPEEERMLSLKFISDGSIEGSRGGFREHFWSGNMLVGFTDGFARKMLHKTYSDYDFLLIEKKEGFDANNPPKSFMEKYRVYLRISPFIEDEVPVVKTKAPEVFDNDDSEDDEISDDIDI